MPDDNLTPSERKQNRENVDRGLRDGGIRLGDLRASMVAQQNTLRNERQTALARPEPVLPPELLQIAIGTSFPTREFSPGPQSDTPQQQSQTEEKTGGFIVVRIDPIDGIAKAYEDSELSVTLGPEVM